MTFPPKYLPGNLVYMCLNLHVWCMLCAECMFVCVCVCDKYMEQFGNRSPFCYAGQLTLRHNLLAGDVFLLVCETRTCQILLQTPDLNTSAD